MINLSDGNGRHQEYLSKQAARNIIKWTWANEVLIFRYHLHNQNIDLPLHLSDQEKDRLVEMVLIRFDGRLGHNKWELRYCAARTVPTAPCLLGSRGGILLEHKYI